MSQPIDITLNVNGRIHRLNVPPRRILADLLRDQLQLTGCKIGCDQAVCGFCTPGMILSVKALLARHPDPDETLIRQWLNANICRCTGYQMIIEAARAATDAVAG
jgi:aerobic-type carbon monoxide dehydrogenase small subunit (CoxS/CutS family)